MIRSKTYLPLAAVAALGLGLYGCGGGGGDGPATMMPEPEPDPGAVADAIDFTANGGSTQGSSNWWHSQGGFAGENKTTGFSYQDSERPHVIVSNDTNGDLQLNVGLFDVWTYDLLGDSPISYNRYISTYDGAGEDLEGVTQSRRLIEGHDLDEGEAKEWSLTELTKDHEDGSSLTVYIATDLDSGTTATDPFYPENQQGDDIVLDDLDDAIPGGVDHMTVSIRSTDAPIRGKLNGEPGQFSCSEDRCNVADDRGEGNYAMAFPGLVFEPDDGTEPVDVVTSPFGYAPAADYLAFGYWLYVPADLDDTQDYTFGVFGSGGDLFRANNLEGLEGTATYEGDATGMYFVGGLSNNPATGYFTADVKLDANFGTSSDLGSIEGMVDNLKFEDHNAHATLFPEMIVLDGAPAWLADDFGVAPYSTNIFDEPWGTLDPEGFAGGGLYGTSSEGNEVFWGTWFAQFHGNGAASTDHPAGIAGTFASFLPAFDGNGDYVPGPADRGLAGGFAARKQDDQQ